jgi:tRNA threonylcarbamoyladenosine biosynthesis protein TsaE
MFEYVAKKESETVALGAALAEVLPGGTTVALIGTLGAGKTRLVQAIAENLGIAPGAVVSPTFVLAQEYAGRKMLYHFDAYRLRDDDEFSALGPDEYFESDGLTFIEWADRVQNCLPRRYLQIEIDVLEGDSWRFEITAFGGGWEPIFDALRRQNSVVRSSAGRK